MAKALSAADQTMVRVSSRLIYKLASPLLPQMGLTTDRSEPVMLLDNACGTSVVTHELHKILSRETLSKGRIVCADKSADSVNIVKWRIENENWCNTEAIVLDAQDTGLADNSFTHLSMTLGLHIVPNPDDALKDAIRILKPGGIFGATTFHDANSEQFWVPDVYSAMASLPFDAPLPERMPMQLTKSGHWTDPAWIESHLKKIGFEDVTVQTNEGSHFIEGVDEFMDMASIMIGMLMSWYWSEEQRAAHGREEVERLMGEFWREKYGEKGWWIRWTTISMTGRAS